MELMIGEQALSLITSLVLGALLGVLYDFFRPVRYASGKGGAAACDILCCLIAAFTLFLTVMRSRRGAMGTWKILMLGTGAALYFQTVSAFVLRAIFKMWAGVSHTADMIEGIFKKLSDFAKFHFHNAKKCFIIKK